MRPLTLGILSPPRRRLIEAILRVNHGRLEGIVVQNGDPTFNPPLRVVSHAVYGKRNGPDSRHILDDFVLNEQFIWLLELLGTRTLTIQQLVISDGLPVYVDFVEGAHV